MKKSIAFLGLLGFFTMLVLSYNCADSPSDVVTAQGDLTQKPTSLTSTAGQCEGLANNKFCPNGDESFCSELPKDVDIMMLGYVSSLNPDNQPHFDIFSWQTFVALNWPADAEGNPTGSLEDTSIGSTTVWETFESAEEVMNEQPQDVAQLKNKLSNDNVKVFYMSAKNSNDPDLKEFLMVGGKPLIDRNLNFVSYEQKINPTEADFIRKNKLTTKEGIFNFAQGNEKILLPPTIDNPENCIEVKASWRIVDEKYGDDLSRYYTKKAIIYVPASNSTTDKAFSIDCTVGLVGMHIITKTGVFKEWIWSTFEHIDNMPDNPQEAQNAQNDYRWSFYNQACLNCPVNTAPDKIDSETAYKWSPEAPHADRYGWQPPSQRFDNPQKFGTQVTRNYPIYYCTEEVNQLWQSKLGASVFANYRLIGSQWTKDGEDTGGAPVPGVNAPLKLANSTMETYMQPKSSCINCHRHHAEIIYRNDTIKTDFSFVLAGAD